MGVMGLEAVDLLQVGVELGSFRPSFALDADCAAAEDHRAEAEANCDEKHRGKEEEDGFRNHDDG